MTGGQESDPTAAEERGIGDRLAALLQPILALPPVREARAVLAAHDAIGGGLLAAGLAYIGLVAILPAVVLVVAIVGLIVRDPVREAQVVAALGSYLPPLSGLMEQTVHQVGEGAIPVSIVSLVALVWGASRFYQALDTCFALVFATTPRGLVGQTVRGVLAVVILLGAVVGSILLGVVASFFAETVLRRPDLVSHIPWQIVTPIVASVATIVALALLYRYLPTRCPPWRALLPPAVFVGVAVAILTQIFTYVAPRLIGIAALYGAIGALFATLAWLSFVAQLVLLGAAWVYRREKAATEASVA